MNDHETFPLGTVRLRQEVLVDALRDEVWAAITEGIDHWWVHRVTPLEESVMELDPVPGGRLAERWGDDDGALWGTVVFVHDPEILRLEGALGASAGLHGTIEIELQPDADATRLTLTHTMFGDLGPSEYGPMYADGWGRLWESLKRYVEEGIEIDEEPTRPA